MRLFRVHMYQPGGHGPQRPDGVELCLYDLHDHGLGAARLCQAPPHENSMYVASLGKGLDSVG